MAVEKSVCGQKSWQNQDWYTYSLFRFQQATEELEHGHSQQL